MKNDFFKRFKGDQQGLQLDVVECAVSCCDSCCKLNLPVNGALQVQVLCS